MRRLARIATVGAGLCCALLLGAPAATASDSPGTGFYICSEHVNPGLLGGLLPSAGSQTKSCMSSSSTLSANPLQ